MPQSSIYALCDPETGNIRYVGRTSGHVMFRLGQHIVNAFQTPDSDRPIVRWILDLADKGRTPKIVLLEECDKSEAPSREAHHIKRLSQSYELLNVQSDFNWTVRKNITLPEDMHAEIKLLAQRDGVPVYAVVAEAVRLYKLLHQSEGNHANNYHPER